MVSKQAIATLSSYHLLISSSSLILMDSQDFDNSRSRTIDESSSPYFLHHSDGPGLVLVSQEITMLPRVEQC